MILFLFTLNSCHKEDYAITEVVCSEENDFRVQLAQDIHAIEVRDGNDELVTLDVETVDVTQSVEVSDTTDLNYDLFASYFYTMQLSFSFDEGDETYAITMQTNRFEGGDSVTFSINGEEQAVNYNYTNPENAAMSWSYYTSSASYTHDGEERTITVIWYGGTGSDYQHVETVYDVATTCTLNCQDIVTFAFGDGTHKIECSYSCTNGTKGSFESDSQHSDYNFDTLDFFYNESEIQSLMSSCTYESHTIDPEDEFIEAFTVPLN